MPLYENRSWISPDGLKLHYRDYAGRADRPPILCLPGLTRNARDFAELAKRLGGEWRVIAVSLRGRGESAYARDPMTYVPATYVADVEALLAELAVPRWIAFGTSLGAIVTMLLAERGRVPLAAALLNDAGPDLEPSGLGRIRAQVGRASSWPTWMHAARCVAEAHADIYPAFQIDDWLGMAKRLYRVTSSGRIVLDYDMKIAEPFRVPGNEAAPDMWHALAGLRRVPTLIVRGERSDILGAATAERMAAGLDRAELVTVPATGHAPLLSEPEVAAAIDRLLARVAAEPAAA
ncbi:alpha/beta fold hydrolase [Sphingomonas aracearum]|uniref:Alpha/beta hydrolase n=1 Tax=Sphingomonas aracearum TaxID=2283317 RepID=A0A369VVX4_9SPHN|nr:alpha/beta hydrolase [Sphingomonas aracearum]RDE06546.1 alpha/beta hydrolase [Sphingomonas aracearum]